RGRGAERDPRARRLRDDDGDRDARDELRARHGEPRLLPRRRADSRAGPGGAELQAPARTADAAVPGTHNRGGKALMKRLRDLGLRIGDLEPGPRNAITDVRGVSVGHVTVRRDEPDPPEGRGIARTGITAIVPGPLDSLVSRPTAAGTAGLNGAGELTSSLPSGGWGLIELPVELTLSRS